VLSLATKRRWTDRATGERMSETTWHCCSVWGKLAEVLTKLVHVQVEGEIRTREYTSQAKGKSADAPKKSITEIRVFVINKLDRLAKGEAEGAAA
jgi:single-strand DNA-binding protein